MSRRSEGGAERTRHGVSDRVQLILGAAIAMVLMEGLLLAKVLPWQVAAVSVPFIFLLLRFPVMRRLAVRNALRRPRETLLVLLGSMLGTAIITGSFIVGDTLDSSIRQGAYTQLGPIDEIVVTQGFDRREELRSAVAKAVEGRDDVDGTLDLAYAVVSVAGPDTGADRRAKPRVTLAEIDFAKARDFGGDDSITGIDGATPDGDRAVVGEDLADGLGVAEGGTVEVFAYGTARTFTVERLIEQKGVAGFSVIPFSSDSLTMFVAPGTIQAMRGTATAGQPPTAAVAVSNVGGIIDGADATPAVKKAIEGALGDLPAAVSARKQELLSEAEATGKEFTQLFFTIGIFSVIAGLVLIYTIFRMLADERRAELGMLRAVGLRRGALVGTFSLEGWIYGLTSAAIGAVVGIGIGRVIVIVAAGIFSGAGDFSLDLQFTASLGSIQSGFTYGFVMAVAVVVLTSISLSRFNIIAAIRDLPEPRKGRLLRTIVGVLLVLVGLGATFGSVATENPGGILGGPALVALGLGLLLGLRLNRRAVTSVAAVLTLGWEVIAFEFFPDAFAEAAINVFAVQGITLAVSAVALVTVNQTIVAGLIKRIAGPRSLATRLGTVYPLAKVGRTATILLMYTLVVFTLTFITVFSHLFQGQIETFTEDVSGGFDLQVRSNQSNPVPPDQLRTFDGLSDVAVLSVVGAEWKPPDATVFEGWPATTFDEKLLAPGVPTLARKAARFETDADAYLEVLANPRTAIVSEFFLQGGGGPPDLVLNPGEKLQVRDPLTNRVETVELVAIAEAGFGNDRALINPGLMKAVFGERATPNLALATVADGADVEEVASRINARFLPNGAEADSFEQIVSENLAGQTQFFRLMQGYLALGLIVSIAGLGVVMIRAVRERRREVGVLRSLGFPSASVRRAFLIESSFVALEGIAIGTSLALLTAWRLVSNDTFGGTLDFTIPWGQLAVLVVTTLVVSLLATAAPAQQASRIRPAVALRIAD